MYRTLLLSLIILYPLSFSEAAEVLNLTLEEAKIMALENNRNIQIQRTTLDAADGEITRQHGAFDPLFFLSSSYTDADIPTVSAFIEDGTISEKDFRVESGVSGRLPTGTFYDLYNFSVTRTRTDSPIESLSPNVAADLSFSIGQDLLRNFGRDINLTFINVARTDREISQSEYERIITEVLVEVERDYWLLVSAQKNLELEQKALELAIDLEERNRIQVEVGVLPRVAITQAQAEVAARQVDLINAQNLLEEAEDRLKNRIVMPMSMNIKPADEPQDQDTVVREAEVLQTAYEKRPEIEQRIFNIDRSEMLKRFHGNQRLPSFSIEGILSLRGIGGSPNPNRLVFTEEPAPIPDMFSSQSKAFSNLIEAEFPTWTIMGVISYPIFNREARGQYVKAEAEARRNVIELQKVKEEIELEVRNTLRSLTNSKRRIDAAASSVELAEEVLSNELEKLEVGLSTTREILEAQRDLINAEAAKIAAITDFNIALAELEKVRGTMLESNNIVITQDRIDYGL